MDDTFTKLKMQLADAQAAYGLVVHTAHAEIVREASNDVKAAKADISAFITADAHPCPSCGLPPVGIEHNHPRSGSEYEIGCLSCPPLVMVDGSIREYRARGGMLPKHCAEAWNAGPEYWVKKVST